LVGLFLIIAMTPAFAQAPGWVLYTHPDKLMSVRFPDKPAEFDQETPSPIGKVHYKVAAFSDGNRTYIATAVAYPTTGKFNVKGALDGGRDHAIANIKAKVVSEKPIKLDGFEGREVWFAPGDPTDGRQVRGVLRIFASASPPSAFLASAMRMTEKADPDSLKFLDSVHLGKKVETQP
jgi:hypothetical protein